MSKRTHKNEFPGGRITTFRAKSQKKLFRKIANFADGPHNVIVLNVNVDNDHTLNDELIWYGRVAYEVF